MRDLAAFKEDVKPLLRPHQMEGLTEEVRRMETMLDAPPHITKGINKREAVRRLRSLRRDIETQAPQVYETAEIDPAARRAETLLVKILEGMPTQEEMRRNPPGAVDKHRAWERRNKKRIAEWKNIQLRLHASRGADRLTDEADVANLERYRPRGGAQQLAMDNAQIPERRKFYIPPVVSTNNVLTDEERSESERQTLTEMRRIAQGDTPLAAAYRKALAVIEAAVPADQSTRKDGDDDTDDASGDKAPGPLEQLKTGGDA